MQSMDLMAARRGEPTQPTPDGLEPMQPMPVRRCHGEPIESLDDYMASVPTLGGVGVWNNPHRTHTAKSCFGKKNKDIAESKQAYTRETFSNPDHQKPWSVTPH